MNMKTDIKAATPSTKAPSAKAPSAKAPSAKAPASQTPAGEVEVTENRTNWSAMMVIVGLLVLPLVVRLIFF